jgi:hypothetical protein
LRNLRLKIPGSSYIDIFVGSRRRRNKNVELSFASRVREECSADLRFASLSYLEQIMLKAAPDLVPDRLVRALALGPTPNLVDQGPNWGRGVGG